MTNKVFIVSIIAFILGFSSHAQVLSGSVTDENNEPLPFASIFIKEASTGTTTNEQGKFEIKLKPGEYQLIIQFIGYETKVERVSIGSLSKTVDFSLAKRPINLNTIDVYEGREDPAYTVMRKAIAKADYHRQQLDAYQAKVYMKGSGKLTKTPRIFRKPLEEEGVDTSTTFTTESVSEISYKRPNEFKEHVISIYQSGEENSTSPNQYINNSFYQPMIAEAVSPLSPKAFAYYKFKLDDYFVDRGYSVNKIQVTPRSRGEQVFEGFIYIVEDDWAIYRTDLETYRFGIKFRIEQNYAPIENEVWLPINHQFAVTGKIFGFGFRYNYLATVSDYQITINPDLSESFVLLDETINEAPTPPAEIKEEKLPKNTTLEKLENGEEITRKELRKLMKEYEKDEQKALEEPEVIEDYEFTIDSMATKRDSTYWETIRPIPLTIEEIKGYEKLDSLARVENEAEKEEAEDIEKSGKNWNPLQIITGKTYKLGDELYFEHESLLSKVLFNPVEGFSLHNNLQLRYRNAGRLTLEATPRYAFASDRFSLKGRVNYRKTLDGRTNEFQLEGGRYIFQYNHQEPIDPYLSAIINLFEERNLISLYEKDFVQVQYQFKPNYAYEFSGFVEWADRRTLQNNTTQTWFNRENRTYAQNFPVALEYEEEANVPQKALLAGLEVKLRPWQKYKRRKGDLIPINDSSPTLSLVYKKGIPDALESEVDYDYLEFGFKHHFKLGVRGIVDIQINSGLFLNDMSVNFVDYRHFYGNKTSLVTTEPVGSFRLLDYYTYSTKSKFFKGHVHYQFRKFLFTQIPEVWLLGIKENVFINYLTTPKQSGYFEVGYGIDQIFRVLRIEAAVGFNEGKYQDFGVLIGIASNLEDLFD